MAELAEKLGIDWRLLLAQIVNFAILAVVLTKLVYRPLVRTLERRSKTIAKSLDDAQKVEQMLAESRHERDQLLAAAQRKANAIVSEARTTADAIHTETIEKTRAEIDALHQKAEANARMLEAQMLRNAQDELANLVVQATEKVVAERLDAKKDRELVKRALAEVVR